MYCNTSIELTDMGDHSIISISNLSKRYRLYNTQWDRLKETLNPFGKKLHHEFYALNDISLRINEGEVVGIIGKNGCGKSTLLKIIAGVLTPSSGETKVKGRVSALLELGAGFNPEMTGMQNIYLNGTLCGLQKRQVDDHLEKILDFADIGEFIYQPVKIYSSGMFARLAFSIAINVDPDILIVDEILSVGDISFQRKCFAQMEKYKKEGKTIIFVSHIAPSIVELCDRAIMMHDGDIVIDGHPKLVTNLYAKYSASKDLDKSLIRDEFSQLCASGSEGFREIDAWNPIHKKSSAYFDGSIISHSKVVYDVNGSIISNPRITTLSGREVNVLMQGEEYFYLYDVEFLDDLESVQYGMLIKTTNGVELSGAAFPSKSEFIPLEEKGKKTVRWRISMHLNNGTYFVNGGVLAKIGDKIDYSHRILDLLVFKVLNAHEGATGYFKMIDCELDNPTLQSPGKATENEGF